jgi:O-antigen/teichoic acid export membrane protein
MRRLKVRPSLTTNAVSLMVATLVTNAVGLVFWAEAARLRAPVVVGRAAAAVAALTLLATIAQLNLTNVFVRLLPGAGRLGRRLIARGYGAVLLVAVIAGGVYALSGLGGGFLGSAPAARILFALAVPVLAIFALQDAVLTALRRTPWVPVENVSFAVAKLALLPALVLLPTGGGIVIAWVLPAAVAVLIVNALLFTRVLPRQARVAGSLPGRRRLVSFVAGEYTGNICAVATVQLMPLLVVWRLGPAAAAYFTIPWLIAMGITLMLWNVASSFVVEMASGIGRSTELLRRSLMLWAGVALAACAVCVLGARPILSVAGPGYAEHGAQLLRLIGLSVPFSAITAVWCTLVWLDQRVWALAGFQAASGAVLLAVTLILLPHLGLVAVAWSNLIVQAATGLAAAVLIVDRLRLGPLVASS